MHALDDKSADEIEELLSEGDVCVFATDRAKNIIWLQPDFQVPDVDLSLPVVLTLRSFAAIEAASRAGGHVVLASTGVSYTQGQKFMALRNRKTRELRFIGDYRCAIELDQASWTAETDWFWCPDGSPLPYGAYVLPKGIAPGARVRVLDVLDYVGYPCSGQGDTQRITDCAAVWTGSRLEFTPPECHIVG